MKQFFLFAVLSLFTYLDAFEIKGVSCRGKIDLSAAIADLDILESGKTIETLHMKGVKAEAYFIFWKGICIKPGLILLGADGQFSSYAIGVGQYLPWRNLCFLPSVGVSWTYLRTKVDFPLACLEDVNEKFRSISPYVGIEITWKITDKWYLCGLYQYAWSHTHTTIDPIVSQKSHSEGPNYGLGLEYSIDDCWSITLGAGYNITLSHEKHGIRGKGAKLGITRYF